MLKGQLSTNSVKNRYYTLYWNSEPSIANNQSKINWSLYAEGTSGWVAERTVQVIIDGQTVYSKGERVERRPERVASNTIYLNHDDQGEKQFNISIKVAVYSSGINATVSKNFTLDQIARKAVIQLAPNFTDEDNPTITYKNPAGDKVTSLQACISFDGSNDDIVYRNIDPTGTSYTFEFTDEERDFLRKNTQESNEKHLYFYVKTELGKAVFYSTALRTMSVINASPTTQFVVENTSKRFTELTGNPDIIIKGFNELNVIFSSKAYKQATIVSEQVINSSNIIEKSPGKILNTEDATLIFRATDSRKNIVENKIVKKMVPYFAPICKLQVENPNAEGEMNLTISGKSFNESFGNVSNGIHCFYRYAADKEIGTDWIEIQPILNGELYTAAASVTGLDYRKKYTVQARIVDELTEVLSPEIVVKTIPVFDWSDEDFMFNVPVFAKGNPIAYYPVGAIYLSVDSTSPEVLFGGKWEQIKGRFLLGADEKYNAGKKGGESEHALTIEEMPRHYHDIFQWNNQGTETGWVAKSSEKLPIGPNSNLCSYVGGSKAHNNMPPYLAVYIWKRIA